MSLDEVVAAAFARKLVRYQARRLAWRAAPGWGDAEDAEQELWLALARAMPGFDPRRGSLEAYVGTVVLRAVARLVRARHAARRGLGRSGPFHNAPDWEDPTGADTTAIDRRLDMAAVLAELPAPLREIAESLKSESASAVARRLKLPRATLVWRMRKLRKGFAENDPGKI